VIFQFVFEILIQIVAEVLFEIGFQSIAETIKRPITGDPFLAAVGYALLGTLAGGVSLLIFPAEFIHDPTLRIVNLIVSPTVAGLTMMLIGSWRRRRGQDLVRLDHFSYGFLFALCMAAVRFQWAG
jgi:hypothetical protein